MIGRNALVGSLVMGAAILAAAGQAVAAPAPSVGTTAPSAPGTGSPDASPPGAPAAAPAGEADAGTQPTAAPAPSGPEAAAPPGPAAGAPPMVWPAYRQARAPEDRGQARVPPPPVEEPTTPLPRILGHHVQLDLGVRSMWIANEGFEPYAGGDVNLLAQLALGASYLPFSADPFTLGLGVEYDVGARSQQTRGQDFALTAHRLAGSVVGDFTIMRYVHLFARVAPAALYLHGSIEDAALPERPLVSNAWTWAVDATGGVGFMLGAVGDRDAPDVGFWITAELGYSFAGKVAMSYAPRADDEDPRRFGTVELPALRPAGIVNRLSFGLSF